MLPKRRLVLTFDAFGTLFTPKRAIGEEYAKIAAKHGLRGYDSQQVNETYHKAFKKTRLRYPNHGKESGMDPSEWWSTVIKDTFTSINPEQQVPDRFVRELLQLYSTSKPYSLYPAVMPFFQDLRLRRSTAASGLVGRDEISVGIISNTDDRIGSILDNFGLTVSSRRFPPEKDRNVLRQEATNDFDFMTLSYDVGFSKPDHRIFDAGKRCADLPQDETDVENVFVHVGNDAVEDYDGAEQAGWKGIYINTHTNLGPSRAFVPTESTIDGFDKLGHHLWDNIFPMERSQKWREGLQTPPSI